MVAVCLKCCNEQLQKMQARQYLAIAVNDPERFGVVEFDENMLKLCRLKKRPAQPKSNYAVTGLLFL